MEAEEAYLAERPRRRRWCRDPMIERGAGVVGRCGASYWAF